MSTSSHDLLEDGFPHGTPNGYDQGCRASACPAGAEHGLSCRTAKQKSRGDYQYQKLAKQGATPAAIAEALGLMPDINAAPKTRKPARPADLDEEPLDAPTTEETAPVEPTAAAPKPAPRSVAAKRTAAAPAGKPKRKSPDGPSQSEVRAWARVNGIAVNPKGQVWADVVEAYLAAHPPILSKAKAAAEIVEPAVEQLGMRREFTLPSESPDEVLVEGSWFKRDELPTILGNYMRASDEHARQMKELVVGMAELAPAPVAEPLVLSVARAERDTAHTALELVMRKWAVERRRADGLQRALDDERERLAAFGFMLASYQSAAAADAQHIASMDQMVRDLTEENEQLRARRWLGRAS